jgi:hypothetical protein
MHCTHKVHKPPVQTFVYRMDAPENAQKNPSAPEDASDFDNPDSVVESNSLILHILNEVFESMENNRPYVAFLPSLWQATQGATASFLNMHPNDMSKMLEQECQSMKDAHDRLSVLKKLLQTQKAQDWKYVTWSRKRCGDMLSCLSAYMGQQPLQPPLNKLQGSAVKLVFPRFFVPVMHHCTDTENEHPCTCNDDGHLLHLMPTMFHLWHNILDKPGHTYEVPISCGSMHKLLFHMRMCDEEPMDPAELMQLYTKQWMKTYLRADPETIPEDVFDCLKQTSTTAAGTGYIVLHGGYLLQINHCMTASPKQPNKTQPGLRFIIRLFN